MLRKRVSIMKSRTDITKQSFDAHWAGPHVPIVLALPGIQHYVQHHLVPDWAGGHPGIDGIAEVVFDAPESTPSNSHFSEVQAQDELAFVTAVTTMPVLLPVHRFAPFIVWVISREVPADVASFTGDVLVDTRDTAQPVFGRPLLGTEPEPPGAMVSCGFETLAEALDAAGVLAARAVPGERIAVSESTRQR
ncbi:MAG: EthD domain [Subtercola sp.]|nr:EthD domain [Subtercola sp.]